MGRTLPGRDHLCHTPPGHSVRLRCRQTESAPGEAARARRAANITGKVLVCVGSVARPGLGYHRPSAERAWRAMLDLFDEVFPAMV
ncbi:hypothetical protein [Streptomyces sp. OE57]|uniref:hypothetical protein n=1 Tax=Streptomyces lacaronensis TaxID=3379885 RepID=UPI0039B72253